MIIEKLKKTQTKWNPMHAEHVASLWRAGHTAAHIADDLAKTHGIEKSRNSVISKLNTMGLLGTRSMRRQRKSTKSCSSVADVLAGMAARSGIFGKTYPLPPDEPIPATAVTLEDRRPDQCAWPVNHGGPFLYCGARKNACQAFCDHHASVAVLKGKRSNKKAKVYIDKVLRDVDFLGGTHLEDDELAYHKPWRTFTCNRRKYG